MLRCSPRVSFLGQSRRRESFMSASSRWSSNFENPYLICLTAHQLGLLSKERLDGCLHALAAMEPGRETVETLIAAGLLSAEEAAAARKRLAGQVPPGSPLGEGNPSGLSHHHPPGPSAARQPVEMLGEEF